MLHNFTVGEAAAILNIAIVIVQITYPLLTALVAVGILRRQNNAATWSVFGRLIYTSFWPWLLRTDTASWAKVDKRIRSINLLSTLTGSVLAIAAIITPLGLHSTIATTYLKNVQFEYARDESAIGQATQPHGTYKTSRVCEGLSAPIPCPGNDDGLVYSVDIDNGSWSLQEVPGREGAYVTTTIATNISEMFRRVGGSAEVDTIADVFDIQWRSFTNYNNQTRPSENEWRDYLDDGRPRTQGMFTYYQQFLLENQTRAIEGLILSTDARPGIGLRNHTLPPETRYGYTWSEQILWLEPHTECVPLNLSYDYQIPSPETLDLPGYSLGSVINERIVDRGGFAVDLLPDFPVLDINDTQRDPQFLARAHVGAVYTNAILAKYMNLTKSQFALGERYALKNYAEWNGTALRTSRPDRIAFNAFGSANPESDFWTPALPGPLRALASYPNSTLDTSDTLDLGTIARGYKNGNWINISVAGTAGGIMLGMGDVLDTDGNPILNKRGNTQIEPLSEWSQPLFSCISGVKASVKVVDFELNGTSQLSNLVIRKIGPVDYSTTQDKHPLWAIEAPPPPWTIGSISPFWGIIDDDHAEDPNLQSMRQAELWLPAGRVSSGFFEGISRNNDAAAGATAPFSAFNLIYSAYTEDWAGYGIQDFTGGAQYALQKKWRELLKAPETAGGIIDLIWTDLMANAVVSARSTLSVPSIRGLSRRDDTIDSVLRPATSYHMTIAYDWKYAIPAVFFLVIYISLLISSCVMLYSRGLGVSVVRSALNQTAAGRAVTTERYGASTDIDFASTSKWAKVRGQEIILASVKGVGGTRQKRAQEYESLDARRSAQVSSEAALPDATNFHD